MNAPGYSKGAWAALMGLSLAWVYSGLFWIGGLFVAASSGWPLGAVAMGIRLVASLALGIGLSATERWAWAPVVCLSALYGSVAGGVALLAGWTFLTLPASTLSWMPVFWGLNRHHCGEVACMAAAVALLSGSVLWLLWSGLAEFDVPERRPFTTLLRHGAWEALLVVTADAYLLFGWWSLNAR
jgi:hypothetical protein